MKPEKKYRIIKGYSEYFVQQLQPGVGYLALDITGRPKNRPKPTSAPHCPIKCFTNIEDAEKWIVYLINGAQIIKYIE